MCPHSTVRPLNWRYRIIVGDGIILDTYNKPNAQQFRYVTFTINPLRTKLYLSDLKNQTVPRSKHSLLRF